MFFHGSEEIIIYMILAAMGAVVFFIVYLLIPKPIKR